MAESSHIAEFFKKRLALHEFTFQEEDWLKMERKLGLSGLPASHETASHFPVRLVIIILAALTAAFILGWLTSEFIQTKKNNRSETIEKSESSFLHAQTVSPILNPKPGINTGTSPSDTSAEKGKGSRPEVLESTQTMNMDSEIADHTINLQAGPVPGENKHVASSSIQVKTDNPSLVISTIPVILSRIEGRGLENIDPPTISYSAELSFVDFSNTSENGGVKSPLNRWSVGLLLAPDFNSTGFMQRTTVSPAIGGIITYDLTPRWSVSARLLYNNKKYKSSADDYKVPYDYWQYRTNGKIPDNIAGSCRVIDIPVLLTYRFYKKRVYSFTASAGLGSYFLMNEKYKFTFEQENPGADTEWKTEENSNVIFGVANLAIGLSMQTTARTSFVVEPYLKIPLKKMGWGNVNLSGMGLAFSFKYHF